MNANSTATESLQKAASELLSEGKVAVVIGYGRDADAPISHPMFIRKAEDAERLVFDDRCFGNLAVYVSKDNVRSIGKIGIVIKGCDLRAINVLLREHVIKREDIVLIGVRCAGQGDPLPHKCAVCEQHDPDRLEHDPQVEEQVHVLDVVQVVLQFFESIPIGGPVPVFDLEKLLLMSPKRIYRVEVLNEIFILGRISYGGIVNVITRKGDLCGIDLPDNSFFFDFTSFLPQDEQAFPRHEDQEFDSENPDYRNCLYWSPDIKAAPGQDLELDFFTSDNNGDYEVLIRGIGNDGSILQGKCYFRVEE